MRGSRVPDACSLSCISRTWARAIKDYSIFVWTREERRGREVILRLVSSMSEPPVNMYRADPLPLDFGS